MRNTGTIASSMLMLSAMVACNSSNQDYAGGATTDGTDVSQSTGGIKSTTSSTQSKGGTTQKSSAVDKGGTSARTASSGKTSAENGGAENGGAENGGAENGGDDAGTSAKGGSSNKGSSTSKGGTSSKTSAAAKGGSGGVGTTKVASTGGATAKGGAGGAGGTTSKASTSVASSKGGASPTSSSAEGKLTAYHESGAWKGFVYAGVDKAGEATISPANFDALATDGPYCVKGNVPVTADYSAIAMVIFNVNQPKAADAEAATWTPTKGGLKVNVKNNGGTEVIRVQIQGPNGDESETDRWCAQLSEFGKDVVIPWDAFNTACWDNSGTYYKNQPLESALVFVPGMGTKDASPQARAFDYCVNDIGPVDTIPSTGTGTTGPCTNSASASGTLTGGNHVFLAVGGRNAYVLQNNVWNGQANNQTLSYKGTSFTVTSQTNGGAGDSPISFPSIFIGSNFGRATTGSNLPRAIGQISSIPTCLAWSGGASGEYNIAYDVWFDTGNTSSDVPTGGYLMVWFHDPASKQPAGSTAGTVSLAGQNWTVWYGPNHQNVPVVSYVHNGDLASLSFDLLTFIKDATTRKRPNSNETMLNGSWYLTNVFGGSEIWSGGSGVKIDGFSAEVK